MFKYLCAVMLALSVTSCAQSTVEVPNNPNPIQNVDNPGTILTADRSTDTAEWIEMDIEGVDVGVWLPAGWQYDDASGLMLIEHMGSIDTDAPSYGITCYLFVPELEGLVSEGEQHENLAYDALHRVAQSPHLIGAAQVTTPSSLTWEHMDAAYYTYHAPDEVQGWVFAFSIPSDDKILVANVAAPSDELHRLREILPHMLSEMRINRTRLGDAVAADLATILEAPPREAG